MNEGALNNTIESGIELISAAGKHNGVVQAQMEAAERPGVRRIMNSRHTKTAEAHERWRVGIRFSCDEQMPNILPDSNNDQVPPFAVG